MTAQKGSELLLKIGDGATSETFATIGGLKTNTLVINNEPVDITSKDDSLKRTLLAAAGIQSMSAGGSGVFKDDAAFILAHDAAEAGSIDNWQIVVPGHGTYEGPFLLNTLEFAGDDGDQVTYSVALESSGAITFTSS